MQDVDILGHCPYSQWENSFHRFFVTSSPAWGTIECDKPSELDPTAHLFSSFSQVVAPWPLNSCHYKLSFAFHAFSQGSPAGLHGSWLSSRTHLSCSLLSGGWPDLPHFPYFWDRKWGWGLLLPYDPPSPSNNAAFRYRPLPSIIYCHNMWLPYCPVLLDTICHIMSFEHQYWWHPACGLSFLDLLIANNGCFHMTSVVHCHGPHSPDNSLWSQEASEAGAQGTILNHTH